MTVGPAPAGWPASTERVVLAETDSTLDEAARRFADLTGPCWILALNQTKARGRRGRAWQHPVGNLAATLVLPDPGPPDRAALRSFTAALALYDALHAVTGRTDPFALKWPNDVLLNGGKLAGILLETLQQKGRPTGLAIGIGVNLAMAPDSGAVEEGALRPVSLAGETAVAVSPEDFLTPLAAAFAGYEAQFAAYGFAPLRQAWLDRATRIGTRITARMGTREETGIFETIDDSGRLILQTDAGRQAIAAAEIYF
ncbi:biotin--[acetyl-CoA-carboxylase] ligase [Pseudooceanicola nanhaiensis]|uniref:biotin--[acetyl-CoA-carboxylase] ligase n=1 Tax=Pseudooceanicola nanhaiensis TaxID=375761 RepID=UPI001CD349F1|nr:biotin--[acetyl-CoA-carboxylase] ligase [Pseudooceanicola nanhaiensis]MCA0921038.1 biotin--[acetyl-CoA-carboxylase] ligase [Pseudooceanicola nanhaiensis]